MSMGAGYKYGIPMASKVKFPLEDVAQKKKVIDDACDEFDVMRLLATFDIETKERICIWLQSHIQKR
jgi:hypothetical protein